METEGTPVVNEQVSLPDNGNEPPVEVTQEPISGSPETPVESGGDNPAWAPILEVIPEGIRQLVTPKLKEWDQGVNARFQKIHQEYEPYKPFKEQGLDPQELMRSHQVREQIDRDPLAFYERLGQYLQQAGLLQEQEEVDEEGPEELDPEDRVKQSLTALEQKQQEILNSIEEAQRKQQEAQLQQQAQEQVTREYQEVEAKYGQLDEVMRNELFQRAFLAVQQAEQQGVEPPSLMQVMDSMQSFIAYVKQAPRPAPKIVPSSGGGTPAPQQKTPGQMTDLERRQAAARVIEAMKEA